MGGIVELVKNGRAIYQRVLTWIIDKVSRTILKSGFVMTAFLVTGKFVISALGMVLVVLPLNQTALIVSYALRFSLGASDIVRSAFIGRHERAERLVTYRVTQPQRCST